MAPFKPIVSRNIFGILGIARNATEQPARNTLFNCLHNIAGGQITYTFSTVNKCAYIGDHSKYNSSLNIQVTYRLINQHK